MWALVVSSGDKPFMHMMLPRRRRDQEELVIAVLVGVLDLERNQRNQSPNLKQKSQKLKRRGGSKRRVNLLPRSLKIQKTLRKESKVSECMVY